MTAVVKIEPRELDSFSGYTDETEAGGTMASSFAPMVKFSNDHRYVLRDGTELPRGANYIAAEIRRYVVKWPPDNDQPPEKELLALGVRWPDLDARNEATPKDEWVTGPDGQLRGPYQAERQVLLLDEKTMSAFLFVTQTTGGAKAVSDLARQTELTQNIYGKPVLPVVTLATALWSPRFKKLRPDFRVVRHVMLSGDTKPVVQEVERPPLQEELKDRIEY
jgi:hypothetical protein